jgi:hypothetical protein
MRGRRREDVEFGSLPEDVQPGDIWRYVNRDGAFVSAAKLYPREDMSGNLTDGVWGYASPDGNGIGTLALHTVREHDDGTVSVLPGDGSSNSILHSGGPTDQTWHGYIRHGVWEPC